MPHRFRLVLFILLASLTPQLSWGHARGENYVFVKFGESSIEGSFEFHLDDLKKLFDIEVEAWKSGNSGNSAALSESAGKVRDYIRKNFEIGPEDGAPWELEFGEPSHHSEESAFASYPFKATTGPVPDIVRVRHEMCYELGRRHRGLLLVQENSKDDHTYGPEEVAMVFSPSNSLQTLDLREVPSLMTPGKMVWQGVLHIWIGIDHILFLLALLLPVVLLRTENDWKPVPGFGRSFWNVLKIVTCFTIAHSITLGLASLELVTLPSRLVEAVIALSIILVAANNITGFVRKGSLFVIIFLGLFHGLGFASVMRDLPFRVVSLKELIKMIVGFNVGVELGQIAILAVLFPVLFFLRKQTFYVPVILRAGSALLIMVAGYWFVQRAFGLG